MHLFGQPGPPEPQVDVVANAIIRVSPARLVAPPVVDKQAMLDALSAVDHADFRPELGRVVAPTLVLWGSENRPNLLAAPVLAEAIPGATITVVPGGGHEWNIRISKKSAREVGDFVTAHPGSNAEKRPQGG